MIAKVIKDKESYENALAEINELMEKDLDSNSPEADRLELLTLLVEDYESKRFPINQPTPIQAIKFRMQQKNLTQVDLIAYLGSRSKVSEVLSGSRPLSLLMIRALHNGLKIPAELLLQEGGGSKNDNIDWGKFPFKEMSARGWISTNLNDVKQALKEFFEPLGSPTELIALYKQTDSIRSARSMDRYALAAWSARVLKVGLSQEIKTRFQPDSVDLNFMKEVARLSWFEDGPLLAKEFLAKHGIALVIEPHLPQTYLDGAAIMLKSDRPVIGLSLRYDRLDNFWFTLMHELAHIALHYGQGITHFYDDLDIKETTDQKEKEADELAGEALIPSEEWQKSPARVTKTPQAVEHLSKILRINPAIIAGRIRREYKSYQILNNLVGHGKVKSLFE